MQGEVGVGFEANGRVELRLDGFHTEVRVKIENLVVNV